MFMTNIEKCRNITHCYFICTVWRSDKNNSIIHEDFIIYSQKHIKMCNYVDFKLNKFNIM